MKMSAKKRSLVWNYFNEASSTKAICTICKTSISFKGGSTANLLRHLKTKHVTVQLTQARLVEEEEIGAARSDTAELASSSAASGSVSTTSSAPDVTPTTSGAPDVTVRHR